MTFSDFAESAAILPISISVAEAAPVALWWERLAGKDDRWRVVKNGKPLDDLVSSYFWDDQQPVVSANGAHYAYPMREKIVENDEALHLVVDGIRHGPYNHIWGVSFSDDAQHFVYAASIDSEGSPWAYFLDGEPFEVRYDSVWPAQFSPSGTHVAWKAKRGEKHVIAIDGTELQLSGEIMWGPEFDEFERAVWVLKDGKEFIWQAKVLDGRA